MGGGRGLLVVRLRAPDGPFITSTEAYLNASGGALLMPSPSRLGKQGPRHYVISCDSRKE